jgi:signal transduction histidine kinase
VVALDGALEIEVRDDGDGLGGAVRNGVGLSSMRERAAELGGTLSVERTGMQGTRVRARLPVGHDA